MEAYIIAGVSLVLSGFVSLISYLMREKMESLTKKIEQVDKDIVQVQINYVQKTDLLAMRTEILAAIERLDTKLDNKSN